VIKSNQIKFIEQQRIMHNSGTITQQKTLSMSHIIFDFRARYPSVLL